MVIEKNLVLQRPLWSRSKYEGGGISLCRTGVQAFLGKHVEKVKLIVSDSPPDKPEHFFLFDFRQVSSGRYYHSIQWGRHKKRVRNILLGQTQDELRNLFPRIDNGKVLTLWVKFEEI